MNQERRRIVTSGVRGRKGDDGLEHVCDLFLPAIIISPLLSPQPTKDMRYTVEIQPLISVAYLHVRPQKGTAASPLRLRVSASALLVYSQESGASLEIRLPERGLFAIDERAGGEMPLLRHGETHYCRLKVLSDPLHALLARLEREKADRVVAAAHHEDARSDGGRGEHMRLACASCGSLLCADEARGLEVLPLPSASWYEMAECASCHGELSEIAAQPLVPRKGLALKGEMHYLVQESEVQSQRLTFSFPGDGKVRGAIKCARCRVTLGTCPPLNSDDTLANTLRFFSYMVKHKSPPPTGTRQSGQQGAQGKRPTAQQHGEGPMQQEPPGQHVSTSQSPLLALLDDILDKSKALSKRRFLLVTPSCYTEVLVKRATKIPPPALMLCLMSDNIVVS